MAAMQTVINTNDSGPGSLRQAILTSNGNAMADTIQFNIPVADPGFDGSTFTIKLLSPLPNVTDGGTLIDGATQTAFTGNTNAAGPEVVVTGAMIPAPPTDIGDPIPQTHFIRIISAGNTIKGLVINGFPSVTVIDPGSGETFQTGGFAIDINGPTADNNVVVGNYIGTNAAGSAAVPNGGLAISLANGSDHNIIGGTAPGDGNVISGNTGGIRILGAFINVPNVGDNTIQGNIIGLNATGTAEIGNVGDGITIIGSINNLVGGTASGARNVVSANTGNGVRILGRQAVIPPPGSPPGTPPSVFIMIESTGNTVQGNRIGTDASGTEAAPNGVDGIRLNFGAVGNLIGGSAPGAGNLSSGNFAHGVHLDGIHAADSAMSGVSGNTIQGNRIGTDVTGLLPIGNQLPNVILFFGAADNLIGGTAMGEGNLIAFSTGGQIPDGLGGFIDVPGAGVAVSFDPDFDEPEIANDPTVRNRISGNSIHSNNGLGIDLNTGANETDESDGVTPNDPGDGDIGANMLQNFPVLTSAMSAGGTTTIAGTLNSTPGNSFTIEFFSNQTCDPTGFGEGQTFLGSIGVVTDLEGNASFTATLAVDTTCQSVTATATDSVGNTSEFSNCLGVDDAILPVISCDVETITLWPASHDLIDVGLSATATDNCAGVSTTVTVFSDEDDEAPTGEGNHSPDARDFAAGELRLRAERDGGGDGRVYLVVVTATDSSGNVTRCCKAVTVARSQSKSDHDSVAAQAAAAIAACELTGMPPTGFFVVGDGPVVGPKQ